MTHLVRYQDEAGGTGAGVLRDDGQVVPLAGSMAQLLALPLEELRAQVEKAGTDAVGPARLLAPLDGRGEVWCAGVTYARSRSARMEESTEQSVYDKIYNSQSVVACSNMPRFGPSKFLTPEQINDAVAYVMSPESPVNK